jgi:hypothetical protein
LPPRYFDKPSAIGQIEIEWKFQKEYIV